jgi:hypothetical protein
MRFYEASADIDSGPQAVWDVLVDGERYPEWDSGVTRVEGRIAPGETIKVYAEVNPGRAFPVKVTAFEPPLAMRWSGGLPLGLVRGERTFTLAADGEATRVTMREQYTGPLVALVWRTMPDLGPSFEQFVRGLKARVEGGTPAG